MKDKLVPSPATVPEELVSQGHAVVKIQDETMMSVAVQRKRDIANVRDSLLQEINHFPEFADRYFYSIPHKTNNCDHATGRACSSCQYVEGPSIHAALALARYWGNCASSWTPLKETDEHFWCVGTFVDYERNTKVERPFRCDKTMKLRNGNVVPLKGDKLAKAINAAGSKAHRNAILAGIPDPLKLLAFTEAKKLMIGDEPQKRLQPSQLQLIENEFAKFEVDLATIERKLGKPAESFTMKDRATLLGLRNALMDGETPEDVFGSTVQKTQAAPVPPPPPDSGTNIRGPAIEGEPIDEDDPFTAAMFDAD